MVSSDPHSKILIGFLGELRKILRIRSVQMLTDALLFPNSR